MLQVYLEEVRGSKDKGQILQPPCINSVPLRPIDTPLSVKVISPSPTPPFPSHFRPSFPFLPTISLFPLPLPLLFSSKVALIYYYSLSCKRDS